MKPVRPLHKSGKLRNCRPPGEDCWVSEMSRNKLAVSSRYRSQERGIKLAESTELPSGINMVSRRGVVAR
jgi:hypothetical protein